MRPSPTQRLDAGPRRHRTSTAWILDEDPDLAAFVPERERQSARELLVAPVAAVARGRWRPEVIGMEANGIGLLVLDGLLMRRVGIDGRFGAELLGRGDLLRPWQGEDASATLPTASAWRVIDRTRLAVLDTRMAARLALYPTLTGALVGRAVNRSRNLAVNMAIVHHARTETRLHMMLWHLAARWGRVRPDGVMVPLAVSHAILADLVAAARPSVSASLKRLEEQDVICAVAGGWLLRAEAPAELHELGKLDARSEAQLRAH